MMVSCAEKVVEEPENLIPKEQMMDILHDLAIFNAAQATTSRKFKDSRIDIMDFIYTKYDIDSAQFSQSDLYYASLPLEYQAIYEGVEARVKQKKDTLEAIGKRRNDSVRAASYSSELLKRARPHPGIGVARQRLIFCGLRYYP